MPWAHLSVPRYTSTSAADNDEFHGFLFLVVSSITNNTELHTINKLGFIPLQIK